MNLFNHVLFLLSTHLEFDDVPKHNVFKTPKKAVAVPCNADIANLPNLLRTPNSPNPAIQCQIIGIIENWSLKTNLGHPKNRERLVFFLCKTRFVCRDAIGGPQPKVNLGSQNWICQWRKVLRTHAKLFRLKPGDRSS